MFNRKVSTKTSTLVLMAASAFCLYLSASLYLVDEVKADAETIVARHPKTIDQVGNMAKIETNFGTIEVELSRQDAPRTVENFTKLASAGFYDGTRFHRVIKGFMIQGGDPLSKDVNMMNAWGTGGPGYTIPDEHMAGVVRGVIAMANSGPNTGGSQFFIVTIPSADWLNGHHAVFGKVTKGMDVVDAIEKVETTGNSAGDRPLQDVIIKKVTLE